jgi:hypothetical protein
VLRTLLKEQGTKDVLFISVLNNCQVFIFGVLHPVARALSRLSGKRKHPSQQLFATTVVAKDGFFPDNLDNCQVIK